MRVVVCTVVHHPADARIFYRQIRALLEAGHDVTYIAPHDEAEPRYVQDQTPSQTQQHGERRLLRLAPQRPLFPGPKPRGGGL